MVRHIALATCAQLPALDPDDAPVPAALADRGVSAEPVVWDDPDVDWSVYDAVVVRSTWDYTDRPGQFVAWARRTEAVTRVLNPAAVLAWNIDKTYQRGLAAAGLPIVPTIWLDPERHLDARAIHTRFPAMGDFVIKPTVSAGSRDTGRYAAGEVNSRALAIRHVKRLLDSGRHVMLQRYLRHVDTDGETALVYIDGRFSHAVHKAPLLDGPFREGSMEGALYREEVMTDRAATPAERDVADRVIDALPGLLPGVQMPLLYARVDLIPDDAGAPVVLELELAEPSLFLRLAPEAVDRLADAIVARV